MSKFYLVRFTEDYADEFDVSGMKVYTEEEFKVFTDGLKLIEKREDDREIEIYFGTNEYLYFYTKYDFLGIFKAEEISEQEYKTLVRLGLKEFGHGSVFDYAEHYEEEAN